MRNITFLNGMSCGLTADFWFENAWRQPLFEMRTRTNGLRWVCFSMIVLQFWSKSIPQPTDMRDMNDGVAYFLENYFIWEWKHVNVEREFSIWLHPTKCFVSRSERKFVGTMPDPIFAVIIGNYKSNFRRIQWYETTRKTYWHFHPIATL